MAGLHELRNCPQVLSSVNASSWKKEKQRTAHKCLTALRKVPA
jgi:hypothetical protein